MMKQQNGSTMVEVLVSMIVLALGLLGVAVVQVTSMKNANNSEYRYRASVIAADMVERIQSNIAGVEANSYDDVKVTSGSNCDKKTNVVDLDKCLWGEKVAKLPNGSATIAEGNKNEFLITIAWNEQDATGNSQNGVMSNSFKMKMKL